MRIARFNVKRTNGLVALAALSMLVAGAGALSGCGAPATLDPIARAAEVTSQQTGAKISLTMQLASSDLPGGITISAHGYIDERRHSGEMTMDLSGLPGVAALPGGGAGTIRMIFQYPVIYMNMPFLGGRLPEGKTWMKLDITKAARAVGIDASQLSSLNQADPTQFLEYLRGSSGNVTTVGSESLFGVTTTHYSATLELSRILDHLTASQRGAAKTMLSKLGSSGAIPVDVWVDAKGRLRRLQLSIAASVPAGSATGATGAGANVSGSVTVDFTSYGPVPPIVPPPAGQVFDTSALAAGLPH